MPEPESNSVDLLSAITAADLAATHALYLAKIGETDPDLFNRKMTLAAILEWIVNNVGAQGKQLRLAKGADVASASALTLGSDGNYFDITGTTAITSIGTKGVGTVVRLHFDGILTLTHHATDLILPTGANITTAAGDEATFVEYATGDWRCIGYQRADGTPLAGATGTLLADASVAGTGMQELLGLNFTDATELTIATGAITATQSLHLVDTEGDAASDDLDTITAAKGAGDVLILCPADDARTVVLKHGTGNIATFNGADISLSTDDHWALLVRIGSRWVVMANAAGGSGLANVGDDLSPELGGVLNSNAFQVRLSKGADVASAGALTLGTDGNTFDITGTTAITSIGTLGVGTVVRLHFDDALTLTHHATDLILPTGANVTTAAGDEATFVEYATGDWRCVHYQRATGIPLAQAAPTGVLKADATVAGTGVQELLGLNFTDATELTIATGAITVTQSQHTVDTESDAASDDLDTITAATGAGDLVFIAPADGARTVVLKHGTGNIATFDGNDISLNTAAHWAILMRFGTTWYVMANAAPGSVFDPASPGAIGGTTPAAGTFTTLGAGAGAFTVDASGNMAARSYIGRGGSGVAIDYWALGDIALPGASGSIDFGSPYAVLISQAAATLQMGKNAATPTDQVFQAAAATSGNTNGAKLTIRGGAPAGSGVQGDVELEGDEILLDAGSVITCDAPVALKSYTYDTTPAPSPAGQLISISNAGSDSSSPPAVGGPALAMSDGSYFRYVIDDSIVGDV